MDMQGQQRTPAYYGYIAERPRLAAVSYWSLEAGVGIEPASTALQAAA